MDSDGVVSGLEVIEGADDLSGLFFLAGQVVGGARRSSLAQVVHDHHSGGASGELDEVDGEDAEWGFSCGVADFEEVDDS